MSGTGLQLTVPGQKPRKFSHLVLDFNGTLANDGRLLAGAETRLRMLAGAVEIVVATADTFGSVRDQLAKLPVEVRVVATGGDKADLVQRLGGAKVVAIGNGVNDVPMFRRAGLRIAVLGPEGLAGALAARAHVICGSANDALDLLLRSNRLVATLRS